MSLKIPVCGLAADVRGDRVGVVGRAAVAILLDVGVDREKQVLGDARDGERGRPRLPASALLGCSRRRPATNLPSRAALRGCGFARTRTRAREACGPPAARPAPRRNAGDLADHEQDDCRPPAATAPRRELQTAAVVAAAKALASIGEKTLASGVDMAASSVK